MNPQQKASDEHALRLIKGLKDHPLDFTLADAKVLTLALDEGLLRKNIIRQTAIEVLDLSPRGIFRSGATEGIVGWVNGRSRAKRQARFWNRIQRNFRKNPTHIVAVAEGDSWFEHPFLLDIPDHLNRRPDTAVFSLAYAADWLDKMLYQGEYIDMLSVIKPDVFLVSGGGNDLLGDKKIGIMCRGIETGKQEKNVQDCPDHVYTASLKTAWFLEGIAELKSQGRTQDVLDIQAGVKYLTREFFGFLNIMQWQYDYLFFSLRKKYALLPIITQSYDYATPQALIKRPLSIAYWYQRVLNRLQGSGKWIETAFRTAKIYDPKVMHQVIKAMLFCFQRKVIETGNSHAYVYHINSHGLAQPDEWFDEIHLKSHKFLQVAQTYTHAMREAVGRKKGLMAKDAKAGEVSQEATTDTHLYRRVYHARETVNSVTFGQALAAFWRGSRVTLSGTALKVLAILMVLLLVLVFSEVPSGYLLRDIYGAFNICDCEEPFAHVWFQTWFMLSLPYKLTVAVLLLLFLGFAYRVGRVLVLSWVFSRPFRPSSRST